MLLRKFHLTYYHYITFSFTHLMCPTMSPITVRCIQSWYSGDRGSITPLPTLLSGPSEMFLFHVFSHICSEKIGTTSFSFGLKKKDRKKKLETCSAFAHTVNKYSWQLQAQLTPDAIGFAYHFLLPWTNTSSSCTSFVNKNDVAREIMPT